MSDDYLRQSPLSHLGLAARAAADAADPDKLAAAGLRLSEKPFRTMVTIRGDASDEAFVAAVSSRTGLTPPEAPNTYATGKDGRFLLWMGPDEWLLIAEPDARTELPGALSTAFADAGLHAAAVEVGEYYTIVELAGARHRDVLAKGCTIDLDPAAFAGGQCVQTLLAKTAVTMFAGAGAIELIVRRSFADYLWHWLEDAGLEYGCVTLAGS